jgi:hypothetical protein
MLLRQWIRCTQAMKQETTLVQPLEPVRLACSGVLSEHSAQAAFQHSLRPPLAHINMTRSVSAHYFGVDRS